MTCPLCLRRRAQIDPSWDGSSATSSEHCLVADMIAHDRSDALTVRDELLECRSIALHVADLVAPVVEAAIDWRTGSGFEGPLECAVIAYEDGLAKLGTP